MDGMKFLEQVDKIKIHPVYALPGDEAFLKRQIVAVLRDAVLGKGDESFGLVSYTGEKATMGAIREELETAPFFGPRRLVVVEEADEFVTKYRAALEDYVAQPAKSGVLILEVKSWPSNTRLAKMLTGDATIGCAAPAKPYEAQRWATSWCVSWSRSKHGKELPAPAAQLLVDLVGPELGLLDQELAKLAIYAGTAKKISPEDVDCLVGRSRSENLWKIFDATGEGRSGEALAILDNLLMQGEQPLGFLGACSMQLRRLARVASLQNQGLRPGAAMQRAGVPPFATRSCEQQLRWLGKARLQRLYDWLIQTDMGLKGSSQLPPRAQLEKLILQLSRSL
jgi:DNA polymerase-3 subunit delta